MFSDFTGINLGKYELATQIGSGGMGCVWFAWDTTLERPVAIKFILPSQALRQKKDSFDSFIAEACRIAGLEHPFILRAYDLGSENINDENLVYLVMCYANRGTLADRLQSGPLSLDETKFVMYQMCQALDYAHSKGVIHLDLKPQNILFDDQNNVLVADFGLAREIKNITHVRINPGDGTREYMPPEQSTTGQVGVQSDVYAVGIMLHEMLTGSVPNSDWTETLKLFLDEKLPFFLRSIIEQATHNNRKSRYQTTGALYRAFAAAVDKIHKEIAIQMAPYLEKHPSNVFQSQVNKRNLNGHEGSIRGLTFSPNGCLLVSGGSDKTICIWDITNDQKILSLKSPKGVNTLVFNPNGDTLALACEDNTVRLWQVANGDEVQILRKHTDAVWSLSFSYNGDFIASGGYDKVVNIWEVASGRVIKQREFADLIGCVTFSPDGQFLAIGSWDGSIHLWNWNTDECLRLEGHLARVSTIAFRSDGKTLVSGGYDRSLKLWDVSTGQLVKLLDGQPEVISRATFSPDGYRLVFGFAGENKGDIVKIWNIQNDEEVYSLPPPKESVSIEIITFNADLNMVALGGTERLPKGSDNATIWLEPLL